MKHEAREREVARSGLSPRGRGGWLALGLPLPVRAQLLPFRARVKPRPVWGQLCVVCLPAWVLQKARPLGACKTARWVSVFILKSGILFIVVQDPKAALYDSPALSFCTALSPRPRWSGCGSVSRLALS